MSNFMYIVIGLAVWAAVVYIYLVIFVARALKKDKERDEHEQKDNWGI